MNRLMMMFPDTVPPTTIIGIIFLAFWGFLSFQAGKMEKDIKNAFFLLNGPALVVLFLLLWQEVIRQSYWKGILGVYTQLFYLPLIGIGFSFSSWSGRIWPAYIVCFLLMSAMFVLGHRQANK